LTARRIFSTLDARPSKKQSVRRLVQRLSTTLTIVSKFRVGIRIAARGTLTFGFESNSNGGFGLLITGAAGSALRNFDTLNNGFGIQLTTAIGVELDDFDSNVNSFTGVTMTGGSDVKMTDTVIDGNSNFGLLMLSSSGNFIDDF
jgi:parallel beta helix pectate lyase-like protein